jgi:outer membrane protein TolC
MVGGLPSERQWRTAMRFATRQSRHLLWGALIVSVYFQAPASADEARVKQLQNERLAALKQIAALKERAFRDGALPLSDCVSAHQQAFEAELELCDNDAERIKVREKMLERAKADEELAARLFRAGEIPTWDQQAAIARRLAIEIELERLKK